MNSVYAVNKLVRSYKIFMSLALWCSAAVTLMKNEIFPLALSIILCPFIIK